MPSLKFEPEVICPDGPSPAAVEKIEQASSAMIFSGTARRWGQIRPRLPLERICAQYGFGFFSPEKSKFVASTAKRQRGLQRGKPGSPLPCFASFCRSKRKAPAASGANYAFVKGSAPPTGEIKLLPFAGNPSVSLAADSLSLRLGHGAALICHWHIIHYRAATSLPLAQGSLWVCRQARRNLFSPITKKKQPFGCFFLVGPAGFGPAGCGSQSPVPYRLATAQSISQGIPEKGIPCAWGG